MRGDLYLTSENLASWCPTSFTLQLMSTSFLAIFGCQLCLWITLYVTIIRSLKDSSAFFFSFLVMWSDWLQTKPSPENQKCWTIHKTTA